MRNIALASESAILFQLPPCLGNIELSAEQEMISLFLYCKENDTSTSAELFLCRKIYASDNEHFQEL